MKLNKIFSALMLGAALMFAACQTTPEVPDGPTPPGKDTTTTDPSKTDSIDWSALGQLPDGCLTVAEARAIAGALNSDGTEYTSDYKYVRGYVKKLHSKNSDGINSYGNASFYMADTKDASDDFLAYQVYALDGAKFTSENQIAVGDLVVVKCHICNYNGTYETQGKGDGHIYASTNPNIKGSTGGNDTVPDPVGIVGDGSQANPYTVADVISLNNTKTGNYFVKGIVVGQVKGGATSANNNCEFATPFTATENGDNTNLLIAAAAGTTDLAQLVPVQLPTGFLRDALNLIAHPENVGKEVVIYGSLEKYFGQAGVKSMTRAFIDGEEIILESGDAPAATVATVAEFNAAPVNSTVPGVYYELTGTIGGTINTTYGNFDLTDATGTVYVYGLTATYQILSSATKANNDKSYASLGLKEGDNVTIRGVRADYNGKIEVLGAYFVKKN